MIVRIKLVSHMGESKRNLVTCVPKERGRTLEIVWTTEMKILMGRRHEFTVLSWSAMDWHVFTVASTLPMLSGILFICTTPSHAALRLVIRYLTSSSPVGGTWGQMRLLWIWTRLLLPLTLRGSGIECCAGDKAMLVVVFMTILSRSSFHWRGPNKISAEYSMTCTLTHILSLQRRHVCRYLNC